MKNKLKKQSGFTMVELLVVLGIFTFVLAIATFSYNAIRNNIVLNNSVFEVVNALREAQSRSIVSKDNQMHGVYFNADSYILYDGPWSGSGPIHPLLGGVTIYSGSGSNIEFSRLTGAKNPAAPADIIIGASADHKKTISIAPSGRISVE